MDILPTEIVDNIYKINQNEYINKMKTTNKIIRAIGNLQRRAYELKFDNNLIDKYDYKRCYQSCIKLKYVYYKYYLWREKIY